MNYPILNKHMFDFNIYRPTTLHFQITERCNLKCSWCYVKYSPRLEMTLEEILKFIIDEIRPLSLDQVTLTGGEPLIRKDISELVKIFNTVVKETLIATNGIMLTEEMIDKLIQSKLSSILISFDSYKEEIFDKIREKEGTYKIVLENIKNLIKRVQETNSNLRVGITCVIQELNVSHISDTIKFALDLGVKGINLQPIEPYGSVYPDFNKGFVFPKLSKTGFLYLQKEIDKILKIRNTVSDDISFTSESLIKNLPQFFTDPRKIKQKCGCWRYIYINSVGELRGCLFSEPIGNIKEKPLQEILKSKEYKNFKKFASKCKICLKGSQYCNLGFRYTIYLIRKEINNKIKKIFSIIR